MTLSGALPPSIDALRKGHSITSSAATSRVCGTVSPSAFTVLRLMTRLNLVARSIGRSPGLSPFSIRAT